LPLLAFPLFASSASAAAGPTTVSRWPGPVCHVSRTRHAHRGKRDGPNPGCLQPPTASFFRHLRERTSECGAGHALG
jgi:hypothetical protein